MKFLPGQTADLESNLAIKKARILVVDDQAANIHLIHQMFSDQHQVFMATGGQQALAFCALTPPDLILLDVAMPGMNGIEVCGILKQQASTANIPIIFLTGLDTSDAENACWDCGADDFVSKPVNPRTLQKRVRAHLTLKFQTDLLRQQAFVDGLTGIANRRQFNDYLAREWSSCGRSNSPLSLAIIDIDHFKLYNDCYGHQQGDLCLQTIAKAIDDNIYRADDLFARYGGEEFCIVLPRTPLKDAIKVIQSIEQVVREQKIPHQSAIDSEFVTVSIGLACLTPQIKQAAEDLITLADQRLYSAKDQGRGRVVYL
jgi:diguanylate cyclase (GGDEF)-like protein